jgi:hypothetical protein
MSDTDHGAHAAAAHGNGHDDHGHAADTLGSINWTMWAVGIIGVLIALVMTVALAMGTGNSFGL